MALPIRFSQGDIPTAAEWNKFSTTISAIYAAWSLTQGEVYPVPMMQAESNAFRLEQLKFVHIHRYLYFVGTGKIVDHAGIGSDVNITDGGAATGSVLDLDSISWMVVGTVYRVQDIEAAVEYWAA